MADEPIFEQRWPVDEVALRRTRRGWVALWTPLGLLGIAVMVGLHGAGVAQTLGVFVLLVAIGWIGHGLWGLTAHIRRSTVLRVSADGVLRVDAFPKRRSTSFGLRRCQAVGLRRTVDHESRGGRVHRYDLVVREAGRVHEFILPGRIGAGGNWSTLSDAEVAAFHAAVARFTRAGAD
jgi:hypothetical protein